MEIERKFLVKALPDLIGLKAVQYERFYLESDNGVERRVQKKDNKYEVEELIETST